MVLIAPSLLSADFLKLGDELKSIEQAGADLLHLDIMDGHFVPNISFGPMVVAAAKRGTKLKLDVHLMIENAACYIADFVKAGADRIYVHTESSIHLDGLIKQIKDHGIKAGVTLNPATNEDMLAYVIDAVDAVLVMSVNPGFGGQDFLHSQLKKIDAIRTMIEKSNNRDCLIAVDGGITEKTIGPCYKAGASLFVAGSSIFKTNDYKKAIGNLRQACQ